MESKRLFLPAAVAALAALTAIGVWQTRQRPQNLVARFAQPEGVMGTSCRLAAIVPLGDEPTADRALAAAEAALRRVEALMSSWIEASELSRLNGAPAGTAIPLSPETREVLAAARELSRRSEGAFDPTCRPLIELWREAGRRDRYPSHDELSRARALVGWSHFELGAAGAAKDHADARLDLGGVAKGYGIDRAVDAMREAGAAGGMVDVGGDLRLFGAGPGAGGWEVDLRSPIDGSLWAALKPGPRAVCTSGHEQRFVRIAGQRLSHIVDPRSGLPAEHTASVTVLAGDAMTADAWATALSVLGEPGLALVEAEPEVEAMVIVPGGETLRAVKTAGFPDPAPRAGFPGPVADYIGRE